MICKWIQVSSMKKKRYLGKKWREPGKNNMKFITKNWKGWEKTYKIWEKKTKKSSLPLNLIKMNWETSRISMLSL